MSRGLTGDLQAERQRVFNQIETSSSKAAKGRAGAGGAQHEDKEAELETLRSVKIFLTEKLK